MMNTVPLSSKCSAPIRFSSVFVTLLCGGLIWVVSACQSDRRESFYGSIADADKAGAIERGWIPDYLPQSSRNIHEVHDQSPSHEWCGFEFGLQDSQALRKNLKSVTALTPSVRRVPSPGVSWWPTMLKGDLDVENVRKAGFDIYELVELATKVTKSVKLFAIDWTKGQAFFYDTPAFGGE